MWELRKKLSLGRYSQRYFSLVAAVILVATFVAGPLFGNIAYAEDAKRSGDSLTYQGKTYTKVANSNEIPQAVRSAAPNTSGFRLLDEQGKKAYFILTATDPATATAGYYVVYDFTPPDQFSNSSPPVEVKIANSDTPEAQNAASQGGTSNCNNSETGAIGWIICPVVTFLASSMDNIYGFIANFFRVDTITNNPNSTLYQMWSFVRDIANVCFVIGFLIIVFSQITSLGISNYGIKKTLPRLIIAAILVNTSYLLAAVSVDISNLLGYSIHSFFQGLMEHFNTGAQYTNTGVSVPEVPRWGVVAGGILAGTTVLGLAVHTGAIFMLVPLLVGAILAALVALIILAARQALIVIMVIISPLAFVAYLLPNTEKYFDKWRSAFLTLLFLFPIFSVLFSGAQVAGLAIVQNANGNILTVILGMAVQVAPLFITPMLIKFSSGILGRVAGMLNDRSKGPVDRLRNWATGAAQERRNNVLKNYNPNKKWQRFDPTRRAVRSAGLYSRRVADRRKNAEAGAQNAYNASRWGIKSQEEARNIGAEKDEIDNRFNETHHDILRRERTAATRKTEVENDFNRNNHDILRRQQMAEVDKTNVTNEFDQSSAGKQVDIARREADRTKKRVEADNEFAWHFRNLTDQKSFEGEMQLRNAVEKAATAKIEIDTHHSELKSGETKNIRFTGETIGKLAADAKIDTLKNIALTNAKAQADSEIQTIYDKEMLKSKTDQIKFDDRSIRDLSAGIGKEHMVLASAAAKYRADWDKEAKAQMELMKHYKIEAGEVAFMSLGQRVDDKGREVKVVGRDSAGNVAFEFDPTDEYTQDAAIERIGAIGSHNQKVRLVEESGKNVKVYDTNGNAVLDKDGNQVVRQGYTYNHRGTINAIMKDFGTAAPGLRDISINETIQGNFNGREDFHYHNIREIYEGRVKAGDLAAANPASLNILLMGDNEGGDVHRNALERFKLTAAESVAKELRQLREANPSDPTVAHLDTDQKIRQAALKQVDKKLSDQRKNVVEMVYNVLTNPNVGRDTSGESLDVIRRFLAKDENASILSDIKSQRKKER